MDGGISVVIFIFGAVCACAVVAVIALTSAATRRVGKRAVFIVGLYWGLVPRPMPKLKLFWKGTLMRLATGFEFPWRVFQFGIPVRRLIGQRLHRQVRGPAKLPQKQ